MDQEIIRGFRAKKVEVLPYLYTLRPFSLSSLVLSIFIQQNILSESYI